MGCIFGASRDDGKEDGNYYIIIGVYIGVMVYKHLLSR